MGSAFLGFAKKSCPQKSAKIGKSECRVGRYAAVVARRTESGRRYDGGRNAPFAVAFKSGARSFEPNRGCRNMIRTLQDGLLCVTYGLFSFTFGPTLSNATFAANLPTSMKQPEQSTAGGTPSVSSVKWADGVNTAVTIDWMRIAAGTTTVGVISSSDVVQTVAVRLSESEDSQLGPKEPRLTVFPTMLQIPPHGISEIQLTIADRGHPEEPKRYNAQLIVTDQQSIATSLHVGIVPSTLQAGITKLAKLTMAPAGFWKPWPLTIDVPLANTIKPATVPPDGSIVGYLHSESGEYVAVELQQIASEASPNTLVARLRVNSMREPRYEGDLYFSAARDRKVALSLIVEAQDYWIWPTVVIALGIVLAALSKIYVGTFRTLWILRRQEADLGRLIKEATKSFDDSAPFSRYSPATDFEEQRVAFRSRLDSFQSWERTIQDNRTFFSDRLKDLSTIQKQISDWVILGHKLPLLKEQIDLTDKYTPDKSVSELGGPPRLLESAKALLIGGPIAGSSVAGLLADVEAATGILPVWRNRANELQSAIDRLRELPPGEKRDLLSETMSQACIKLVNVSSDADLAAADKDIGSIVARLNMALKPKSGPTDNLKEEVSGTTPVRATYVTVTKSIPTDNSRRRIFGWLIEAGDGATFTIGAALAVLTALDTYYIGKPFGTTHDYVNLFLAAAGTKAAVDLVAALVDRFGGVISSSSGT